jgi:hypothetical protein
LPTVVVPVIFGRELSDGAEVGDDPLTTPVAGEIAAGPEPPMLEAVSVTRIVCPTSVAVSV